MFLVRMDPLGLRTPSSPMMCECSGEWGFNDFLRRGLIEYLDVNEENVSLIALYESYLTRCGSLCGGLVGGGGGATPLAERNVLVLLILSHPPLPQPHHPP